ncbi:MAG: pyrroline-5-carboxylate reductase [Spirochaetota bacterium]
MSVLANMTIGCIGTGNMGSAIISCLANNINKAKIICFDTDKSKLESIKRDTGIRIAESVIDLVKGSDVLILAVKPDIIGSVLSEIKNVISDKLIISIAAGISTSYINGIIQSPKNIIRVMPNTPAMIGEGMSVISAAKEIDGKLLAVAEEIFSYLGKVVILPEKLMDAVTAVSGSGPAYGFTLIQAMIDGGVKTGLPRDKATILAAQTILGAAKMVLEGKDDPITLRGKVTSPGGTTIEAVHILERSGFSGIIMDAIDAAKKRSEKLGS